MPAFGALKARAAAAAPRRGLPLGTTSSPSHAIR